MANARKLSRLLVFSHVGLALLLACVLLVTGAGIIRGAIKQRAQAQVAQAAAEALARLDSQRREVGVVAGLLSQRPTLQGYLARNQATRAGEFIDAFRETARVDFIRATRDGEVFAQSGDPPPDAAALGLQFEPRSAQFWYVDTAPMESPRDATVTVARRVPERSLIGPRGSEADVALIAATTLSAPAQGDSDAALRNAQRHVLGSGRAETLGPLGDNAVLRIEPLRDDRGKSGALLVASISKAMVARHTYDWLLAFVLGSAVLVTVAALVAVWLARRIARPFGQLARAAERLGVGDLVTPIAIPRTELGEPLALAHSLEAMRRQVRTLARSERQQRQELDAVLDGVADGIIAIDAERRIRYANRQFLGLVERSEEEVVGAFCGDVLEPADVEGRRPCDYNCPLLHARSRAVAQATERCTPCTQTRNLVIRSTAPLDGRQVAIVREETMAEAASSMRDAILANLSHEFQTPLAAQIASIELLRDHLRGRPDPVAAALVDSNYRGALRLSQLVDNLLDSVRIESGEMKLRREPVDLTALIRDAVDLMQPLTAQRDQQVILSLSHSERRCIGDARRLTQVVINLLANANKFAPDQSTIWIELIWGEETVSLWVEDEGPGLPPLSTRADLFAPFRRAPDQEPSQRGTGLGLAIVRALVERHGGEVVLAHPRHRQGARFGIVLPLEEACVS